MNCLKGKVAIVTGAAGGIGHGICTALASEGAKIAMVVNKNMAGGRKIAESIAREHENEPLLIKADVSMYDEVDNMVSTVIKQWNKVDLLVNNAGITLTKRIEDIDEYDWDLIMNVNVKGHFLCSKFVIPYMKTQGFGKIINMGSLIAKSGGIISGVAYATSKGAVHSFTYGLAKELAPYGITVNAVAPGPIYTEMINSMPEERVESMINNIPLKRFGDVSEVAGTITFLASAHADYITGEVIDINGGAYTD